MLHCGGRERLSLLDTEREKNWSVASDRYLEGNEKSEVCGYGFLNDKTAGEHLSVLLNDATNKHKLPIPNWSHPPKKPDREKKRDDGESSGPSSERALIRKRNNHASVSGNTIDVQTRKNTMASEVGLCLGFVPKSSLRQLTMGASVSAAPVEEPLPRI